MKQGHGYLLASLVIAACVSAGCATNQSSDSAAAAYAAATSQNAEERAALSTDAVAAMAASGKPKPVWTVPSEEEVASQLTGKYLDATRGWVALKKDGELRFCKRYKEIGSSVPRINCLSEAEVRTQVDNMSKYRDDMRNKSGKCAHGVGCSAGF